jgi:signal transduction histidine kinase
MRINWHLIGLLGLEYGEQARQFTADERALAGAVAQLAAVVLERERLVYEREEAHAGESASREATRRLDLFMAMASHEFRNPLTVINRYLQLGQQYLDSSLSAGEPDTPIRQALLMAQEYVKVARQAGTRMSLLLNDLLQVSRAQVGKLSVRAQPCDLITIVSDIIEEQRQMHPTRQMRLLLTRKRHIYIIADPARIGQVVTNYVTNACKYSPEEQPIEVRIQANQGTARVSIRDQGPGLSPANQQAIWECFYQAPDVERQIGSDAGLGVGLYVCRTIVEQHQGAVGVESTVGRGATFWFTLPLSITSA